MLLICHPTDTDYVGRFRQEGDQIVATEHCAMQVIVYLPERLHQLVLPGSWFENAPEADQVRSFNRMRTAFAERIEATGLPRCQTRNKDGGQCKHAAASGEGNLHCKRHARERDFAILRPALGLDQPNDSPVTDDVMWELREMLTHVGIARITVSSVAHGVSDLATRLPLYVGPNSQHAANEDDRRDDERMYTGWLRDYADRLDREETRLNDIYMRLSAIISGDRQRSSEQRRKLRGRLRTLVDAIAAAKGCEGREIHAAWLRAGGKPQEESTVEELKKKLDWLHVAYADFIPVDLREWTPPDVETTGREPGGIRRVEAT